MNIAMSVALSAVIFTAGVGTFYATAQVDHPQESADAMVEVDKFRMFMFVAAQYVQTAPAVTAPTEVPWDTIKASPSAPPAVSTVVMPSSWKIVRFADGTWVGCTAMTLERSVSAVAQLVPPAGAAGSEVPQFSPVRLSGTEVTHVVLGDAAEAPGLATYCN